MCRGHPRPWVTGVASMKDATSRVARILGVACLVLFSPTRAVIDRLKRDCDPAGKKRLINRWNDFFLALFIAAIATAYLTHVRPRLTLAIWVLLWIFPVGRVDEMWYAFWRDAFDRLRGVDAGNSSGFSMVDRLRYLIRSYVEVTINFGILYFFLPAGMFTRPFRSILEALYFSATTITTAGCDIFPCRAFSQFWCIYELAVGFTLVVVTFGSYIARIGSVQKLPDD